MVLILRTKQSNYTAWNINEADYPRAGSVKDQIRFLIGYGILAPSTHNTQPWLFSYLPPNQLSIKPDWSRALPHSDTASRGLFMSLGCCLLNILVAAEYFGWLAKYEIRGRSMQEITVELTFHPLNVGHRNSELAKLFPAIANRQSHKLAFEAGTIDPEVARQISELSWGDARVALTTDSATIQQLAAIHQESTLSFATNRRFSREIASWMRPSFTKRHDGMPGFTFGLTPPQSVIAKTVTSLTPVASKMVAKRDFATLSHAPALGLIMAETNHPASWINAGLLYEQVGLLATLNGLGLAPKAAALEAGNSPSLAKLFSATLDPQLYFGLGHVDGNVRHSPRKSLERIKLTEATH